MKLIENLMWAALAVGLIPIGVSVTESGSPLLFFIILPPLAFWLVGQRIKRDAPINLAFVYTFCVVVYAALRQYNATLLIIGTLGTFCAWDLFAFGRRIAQHGEIPTQSKLIRQHLQTLLTIIIMTLFIALIIFNATVDIGLFWSLLLGSILVVGVSQAIRFLRESDL